MHVEFFLAVRTEGRVRIDARPTTPHGFPTAGHGAGRGVGPSVGPVSFYSVYTLVLYRINARRALVAKPAIRIAIGLPPQRNRIRRSTACGRCIGYASGIAC